MGVLLLLLLLSFSSWEGRGVGASTATAALAVVDFGPTYLVGLLRATYSRATSLRTYSPCH